MGAAILADGTAWLRVLSVLAVYACDIGDRRDVPDFQLKKVNTRISVVPAAVVSHISGLKRTEGNSLA